MSVLSDPRFHDEAAAYAWVEARVWPTGPVCPHCGATDRIYALKGKSTRIGTRKCGHCRKPFTVKVGTIFEDSHLPLTKWLQAIYFMCSSKKGISANQLHRALGVTLKTAWFLGHRIREAMRDGSLAPLGGEGATVEADETYFGQKDDPAQRRKKGSRGLAGQRAVVSLVERGGKARTFHVQTANKDTATRILRENIARESRLMTDESRIYGEVGPEFASHERVAHSAGEYVRGPKGPDRIHTNTVEGYFSVFKRGMKGIYQHFSEKHLHRYLAEFDFRHNARKALGVSDIERADLALIGVTGKRLTYKTSYQG